MDLTHKVPQLALDVLEIVDKFPMTEGGKVLKRELTADVTRKLKAEGKIP